MAADFHIRPFQYSDLAECAAALVPTYAEPPYSSVLSSSAARGQLERALDQEPRGCLVAVAGDGIIGGLFASSSSNDGTSLTISELFVVPQWRRHGVARSLIAKLKENWPAAGKIGLLVDRRAPAYEAYKRLGFVEQERLAAMTWTVR